MFVEQRLTTVFFLLLLLPFTAAATLSQSPDPAPLPQPSVEREPAEVVQIVIEALQNNDQPFIDAGIATTYAFASPSNKANTGPLPRFASMVKGAPYGILVDHVAHEFSEVVLAGQNAYQMVRIKGPDGSQVIFAFRLGQQGEGEFEGMWMTEAVWPVASGDLPEQAF